MATSFFDRFLAPFARMAKQPLESFIRLETADDEQTLVAEDGSLVTFIQVDGSRQIIGTQEYERIIEQGVTKLGISQRTLIGYMLGNADAQEIVNRKLEKGSKAASSYVDQYGNIVEVYDTHTKASRDLAKTLGIEQDALKSDIKETRQKSNAVATLRDIVKSLPKEVKTDIRQNAPEAAAEIKKLVAQYGLTPKQVQTVLKMLGVEESVADIRRIVGAQQPLHRDINQRITITTEYRSLHTSGVGPTRGRGDDNMPSGVSPRAGAGGDSGPAGRFTTSSGRRSMSRGGLDGAEIRVVGMDPGQRAFFYTGGTSRYS